MQGLSGNQGYDLVTSLMKMVLALCLPLDMHLVFADPLQTFHARHPYEAAKKPAGFPYFCHKVQDTLGLPQKGCLNVQKWSEHVVLLIF